jgi:hypothetical protein
MHDCRTLFLSFAITFISFLTIISTLATIAMYRPATLATFALLCFAQFTLGGVIPSASADISQGTTAEQIKS